MEKFSQESYLKIKKKNYKYIKLFNFVNLNINFKLFDDSRGDVLKKIIFVVEQS
jgi:hypothetical protein